MDARHRALFNHSAHSGEPRKLEIIRELTAAATITLPSAVADFDNPEMSADSERFMRSSSATKTAIERLDRHLAIATRTWNIHLRAKVVGAKADEAPSLRK